MPPKCLILETASALLLTLRARKPPLRLSESSKRVSGEQSSDKQVANHFFSETGMRLALLGPRMRRTLYRQDRLAAQGKLGSDDGSSISDDKSIISGSWFDLIFYLQFYTVFSQDSGHGDNFSEISDDNSGKLSPGFATEKVDKPHKYVKLISDC